jgi:hypothetical protein
MRAFSMAQPDSARRAALFFVAAAPTPRSRYAPLRRSRRARQKLICYSDILDPTPNARRHSAAFSPY